MKFKISKKFALYGVLFALTGIFAGSVGADGYENLLHPSIIPTAYQDAQYSVSKSQKAASDAKKTASDSDSGSDAKKTAADATKNAEESKANLADNIKVIMNSGNFGSTGLFFGPTSGNSKVDAYGALTSTPGLDRTGIDNFAANTGQADKVHAYHAFGLAMTHLKDGARKTSGESIGIDAAAGGIIALAKSFSMFGLKLLKAFNPFPVIAAFYDSSFLNNANYTAEGSSEKNELISLVNSNDMFAGAIHLFGDPITIGSVTTSFAYMITSVVVFTMFGYGAFTKLWNGQKMSITFRKAFVKILIASVAIPLVSVYGSRGLSWAVDTIDESNETKEQTIMRNNLNIYNWYKNAAFGLPPGTTLTVKNGYFVFTPDAVEAINKWSSTNRSSANSAIVVDTSISPIFGSPVLKPRKAATPASKTDLSDEAIANGIVSAAKTNKNTTKVSFAPSYSTGFVASSSQGTGGTPWDVSDIVSFAESLGSNKKYDGKDKSVSENPYITNAGLIATQGGNDLSYTFTQTTTQYGISPLAAFNLMGTDFNESGFVVRTNTSDITTPTIAPYVITDASQQVKAPGIVKIVVMFTIMIAGMKSLMTIISSSFGSLFKGGAGSALGSAAGAGNLVGGAIALTLGILGLSVIMTIAVGLMDVFYTFIAKLLFSWEVMSAIQDVSKEVADSFLGIFKKIPFLGDVLGGILTGLTAAVMGIVSMMMMPQLVKTPTIAYGEFVAGIPSAMSERFANWERVFTGDYHSGGGGSIFGGGSIMGGGRSIFGGGGGGGAELEKMKAREAEKRKDRAHAMKTGAGMLASASLAALGSRLAFGKQDSHKDGDVNESTANESLVAEEDVIDGSESFVAVDENGGDFIGPKETPLDEDGNLIAPTLPSLDENGDVVDDSVNKEEVSIGDSVDDSVVPAIENPDGAVTSDASRFESVDDSSIQSTSVSNQQNSGEGYPTSTSSISDTQTHTDGNVVDSQHDNQSEVTQRESIGNGSTGVVTNNGTLTNIDGAESTIANTASIANNADSIVANTEDKSDKSVSSVANENSSKVSQSSVSENSSQPSTTVNNKSVNEGGKPATSMNTTSKPEKSIGKFRQTIGKTMMAMGGVDHKAPLDKSSMKGMATTGALHAVAGAVGANKFTQNHAQRKIDQRNEHIVRNGGQIKSNLSATRESRQDAQKRMEKRVKETPTPIQANPGQVHSQESVRRQRQAEKRQSPKQDPREDR